MADLNITLTNPDIVGVSEDIGQSLVKNGDFEIAPSPNTAPTTASSAWIDGTATGTTAAVAPPGLGGWGTPSIASAAQAGWDNTQSHSGTWSMKLSATNTTGTIVVATYKGTFSSPFGIPVYPSTSYTLSAWIKTNNAATNSVFIDWRQYNSALSNIATTTTTKFSGTNAWTQVTNTITTNAATVFMVPLLRLNVAGNISDAWFDDLSIVQNGVNKIDVPLGPVVTAGIQNISGPKIWS